MSLLQIMNPEQLAALSAILEERCRKLGLNRDHPEREMLAARIIQLFESGTLSIEEIRTALEEHPWATTSLRDPPLKGSGRSPSSY